METFIEIGIYSILVLIGISSVAAASVWLGFAISREQREPDGH